MLATGMKRLKLALGKVKLHDALDSVAPNDAGQRGEDPLFAVLARQENGCAHHGMFVMQHCGNHTHGRIGHGIFGALLAGVGNVAP